MGENYARHKIQSLQQRSTLKQYQLHYSFLIAERERDCGNILVIAGCSFQNLQRQIRETEITVGGKILFIRKEVKT